MPSHSVSVIDPSKNNAVIATITEPPSQTPRELAFDSANGYIYVADVYSNTVSVIDSRTNTLLTSIPTGGSIVDGVAYDPSNNDIYAVNAGSGTVSVISGVTNTVIGTIPVGSDSYEATFDPNNGDIYVANRGSGTLSVIDGSTNRVIDTIQGVQDPVQLVFNPSNGYIYVAGHSSNVVSIVNTRTNSVIGTINNGLPDPTGVGYDLAHGNVYVGNQGSNYVSIISGRTNQVIGSVTVGSGPVSPVFDPNNGDVYVTNYHSNEEPGNTVSVISTTTTQLIPPDTSITSAVDGNSAPVQNGGTSISHSISITFSAKPGTNSIAGFECSLDNSAFSSCSNPTTLTNIAFGMHTFQVRAVDTSGNRDPTPASFSWTIITPGSSDSTAKTNYSEHGP